MRLLIVPDIHNHIDNAEHWLKTQQFERVIFLGDYFDDYGDNVTDARITALWLRQRMDTTEDVFLLGNHDAAYMFPYDPQFECPGFTRAKARGIREILRPEHWRRLQLAHAEQGWLISHAGFHPSWIEEANVEKLLVRCERAMAKVRRGAFDFLFGAGVDRAGTQLVGGPLWMDWDSLIPTPGINQIVGHTPGDEVRKKATRTSENYCLDVNYASIAAILWAGKVEIVERVRRRGA